MSNQFYAAKAILFSFPIIFQNVFIYQICTTINLTENIYGWHTTIKASGLKPQSDFSWENKYFKNAPECSKLPLHLFPLLLAFSCHCSYILWSIPLTFLKYHSCQPVKSCPMLTHTYTNKKVIWEKQNVYRAWMNSSIKSDKCTIY